MCACVCVCVPLRVHTHIGEELVQQSEGLALEATASVAFKRNPLVLSECVCVGLHSCQLTLFTLFTLTLSCGVCKYVWESERTYQKKKNAFSASLLFSQRCIYSTSTGAHSGPALL